MEVLVKGDPDAAEAAMREHVMGSMHRALEQLEPYFKAHKSQQETYSRKPRKQFAVTPAAEEVTLNERVG